jgi:hypothetical protein
VIKLTNGQIYSKTKLLSILQNDNYRVNADRRQRFVAHRNFPFSPINSGNIGRQENITRGDFIIIIHGNKTLFGCVLNITHINATYKREKVFNKDSFEVASIKRNQIGVLLDPVYIIDNKFKKAISFELNIYFDATLYKCHMSENFNLDVRSNQTLLKNFLK